MSTGQYKFWSRREGGSQTSECSWMARYEIKEIFSEWLKDLERYNILYTYERIITPIRQDDDNAEDNPTEDQIWKTETLKRMSE